MVAGAARVHAHGDVAGLLVDAGDHGAGVGVESVESIVVADGSNHATHQRLEIHIRFGGDLTGYDHQAGRGQGLTSYAAHRIFSQAGVENGIGDLVGDFIRMPFSNGLGSEKIRVAG